MGEDNGSGGAAEDSAVTVDVELREDTDRDVAAAGADAFEEVIGVVGSPLGNFDNTFARKFRRLQIGSNNS